MPPFPIIADHYFCSGREDWSEIAKSFELFRRLQLSNQTSIDYVTTTPSGPTEIELTGAGDIQSLPQYQSKDELL